MCRASASHVPNRATVGLALQGARLRQGWAETALVPACAWQRLMPQEGEGLALGFLASFPQTLILLAPQLVAFQDPLAQHLHHGVPSSQPGDFGTSETRVDPFLLLPLVMGEPGPALSAGVAGPRGCCHGNPDRCSPKQLNNLQLLCRVSHRAGQDSGWGGLGAQSSLWEGAPFQGPQGK